MPSLTPAFLSRIHLLLPMHCEFFGLVENCKNCLGTRLHH